MNFLQWLVVCLCVPSYAMSQAIESQFYGIAEGLSDPCVFRIDQNDDGFLYVGTNEGLSIFDGHSFRRISIDNSYGSRSVLELNFKNESELLLSLYRVGLFSLDLSDSSISPVEYVPSNEENAMKNGEGKTKLSGITSIHWVSETGWFINGKTLFRIENDTFQRQVLLPDSIWQPQVYSVEYVDGVLFIGTSYGLFTIDNAGEKKKIWPAHGKKAPVWDILHVPEKGVYMATDKGLSLLDLNAMDFNLVTATRFPLHLIYLDSRQRIWMSSNQKHMGCLWNGELHHVKLSEQDVIVNDIHEDHSGNIWLATMSKGLCKINIVEETTRFTLGNKQAEFVTALFVEEESNRIWAGGYGSVHRSISGDSVFESISNPLVDNEIIYVFYKLPNTDVVLAGTPNRALVFNDGKYAGEKKLPGAKSICNRKKGGFWVGTFKGIYYLANSYAEALPIKTPFSGHVNHLLEDQREKLWVVHGNDLFVMHNEVITPVEMPSKAGINNILESAEGDIYLSTTQGVCLIKHTVDHMGDLNIVSDLLQGTEPHNCKVSVQDEAGSIWIVTSAGKILCYDGSKVLPRYNMIDRLNIKTVETACLARNNEIYLGGPSYLLKLNVKGVQLSKDYPRPYFKQISSLGHLKPNSPFTLRYNENRLDVFYSDINFTARQSTFKYRLNPESDWVQAHGNVISLHSVPAGNHRFELKSAYKGAGVWSEPVFFSFSVSEPLWNKPWFIVLMACVAFALVYILFTRRVASLKRKQILELKHEREVTSLKHRALNAMMNPHFITNSLFAIRQMSASKATNRLKVERYVANFSSLVRRNLELATEEKVLLSVELERLSHYVEMEQTRLQCPFSYNVEIDGSLEPDTIKIPNMILQPIVENSIWHGFDQTKAGESILLRLSEIEMDKLQIVIEDNGKGYHYTQKRKMRPSIGLGLIKEKLELDHPGNTMRIESPDDRKGTRVTLELCLKKSPLE